MPPRGTHSTHVPDKLGTEFFIWMAPGLAPGHYRWTQTVPDLNCLAIFGPSPPQPRRAARRARSSGHRAPPSSPAPPHPRRAHSVSFDMLVNMLARPNYVRGVKSTKFAIAGAKRKNEMLSKFVTHDSKLWPRNFLWQPFETLAYPNPCMPWYRYPPRHACALPMAAHGPCHHVAARLNGSACIGSA